MIILASQTNDMPIMAIVIWVVLILIVLFFRKFLGRVVSRVLVAVLVVFFMIFMIDNYTGHNLRNWIDISFYDKTIEDPTGVAEEIIDNVSKGGKEVNNQINKKGKELDDKLGIERDTNNGKVWKDKGDTESSDSSLEEQQPSEIVKENEFIIEYNEIDSLLKNELSGLSQSDKNLIKSLSPTMKAKLEGEHVIISNKDKKLFDNNKLKIELFN